MPVVRHCQQTQLTSTPAKGSSLPVGGLRIKGFVSFLKPMLKQRLIVKLAADSNGDGPLKKVLRKIEELGLSSDTKVTGFITDKENTRISKAKWMVTRHKPMKILDLL